MTDWLSRTVSISLMDTIRHDHHGPMQGGVSRYGLPAGVHTVSARGRICKAHRGGHSRGQTRNATNQDGAHSRLSLHPNATSESHDGFVEYVWLCLLCPPPDLQGGFWSVRPLVLLASGHRAVWHHNGRWAPVPSPGLGAGLRGCWEHGEHGAASPGGTSISFCFFLLQPSRGDSRTGGREGP